jgi:hypothetical protein
MTRTIVAIATFLAAAGIANAQTTSPSATPTATPPSSGSSATMPGSGGAAAGVTSSADVKSTLEASGYKNVTGIKKDSMGNWTAQATKGAKQVAVSVDSKGMVKEAQQ